MKKQALCFIRETIFADHQLHEKVQGNFLNNQHNIPPKEFKSIVEELHSSDLSLEKQFNEETSISLPDSSSFSQRPSSANTFKNVVISFDILNTILTNAIKTDKNGRRPYPSAGALYPVEIFLGLFKSKIEGIRNEGIFHYRPNSHRLDNVALITNEEFKKIFLDNETDPLINNYNICIIYCINLNKALFKYAHRGLFFALTEIGSIYQQLEITTRTVGLASRVWGAFLPFIFNRLSNTHPSNIIPITCHLIGKDNSRN